MDDLQSIRYTLEYQERWKEINEQIPWLNFDSKWKVKITSPFGGAIVRFLVEYKGIEISVYLDFYDRLGYMKEPYWEIYNYVSNSEEERPPQRFSLNDTTAMMAEIKQIFANNVEIEKQRKSKRG